MKKIVSALVLLITLSLIAYNVYAIQRFPKPEFETGYTQPVTQTPQARSVLLEYLDLFILITTLSLASWLAIKKRSRNGIFWLSLFSLIYFGFYRKGCICPIGSIQNVTLALFHPEYQIPLTAIAFFLVPLFFTLLYGRTFCAAACPLGAIQDVVALQPVSLKRWLQSVLGLIPFIYLGLAVLYAATATDFIICRYDPFVGFFRLSGPFLMIATGAVLLLIGVFIARPYCRFLCPYGVLLNLVSRISHHHLSITPSVCIDCKLCEHSCPFGAINKPGEERHTEKRSLAANRFLRYSLVVPAFIILGSLTGLALHGTLAKVNPVVRLAVELREQENSDLSPSMEVATFRASGESTEKLNAEASVLLDQFRIGSLLLGAFIGLVFGLTLVRLSVYKHYTGYAPDKGTCFSCARCINYCPVKPGQFIDGKPVNNPGSGSSPEKTA